MLMVGCEAPPAAAPHAAPDPTPEVLLRITRPADSGSVHLVRVSRSDSGSGFDPAEIAIPQGDVVRFVMAGARPESVAFDPVDATPEAAEYIRSRRLHLGILMTEPGEVYDVPFPDAPPGRYPFRSLPRAEQGMGGVVIVEPVEP